MDICSPNNVVSDLGTCFTYLEVVAIAKAYNKYIRSKVVCHEEKCIPRIPIDTQKGTKKELLLQLENILIGLCNDHACWTELPFIHYIPDKKLVEKLRYFTFKPKMPNGKTAWLNTKDINNVMQQYARLFSSFKFVGALPADFYKVTKVRFHEVTEYAKVGIVFNLDNHNQPGSHWVAFLVDNHKQTLEYFDSAGKPPNKNIMRFIRKLQHKLQHKLQRKLEHNVNKVYTFMYNDLVHQKENSECGIYSIYFLIQRLIGRTFTDIAKHIVPDNEMNKFRNVIFRSRQQ